MKNVYLLRQPDCDGGRDQDVAVFENHFDAVSIGRDIEVRMGVGEGHCRVTTIQVFSSAAEFRSESEAKARGAALAKLTSEEKRLLGLKD